jgi:hypothetical protein
MRDTRFRGVRLIQLTGLLALAAFTLAAFAQGWQQARAQNVAPLELTFVFRDGAMFNYSNGSGWKGIVGDKIDAGYGWERKWPDLFTRSNIRVVCAGQCPDALSRYDKSPQDKVVWKEGPPTVGGRIEVRCGTTTAAPFIKTARWCIPMATTAAVGDRSAMSSWRRRQNPSGSGA